MLPLHQRVQLMQATLKNKCSSSEALRLIMQEQGRPALADPWGEAEVVHHPPNHKQVRLLKERAHRLNTMDSIRFTSA